MLDGLIPELKDIGPPIEDLETKTGFPAWCILCKVENQISNILQYSGKIEGFLGREAIINPRKCTTVAFQTKCGDFGGRYHYIKSDNGKIHSELFNDAEYYLALDYDGIIIAYVGFNIDDNGNSRVIQIQGATLLGKNFCQKINHNGFLKDFKWKEYLISELISFLKKHNIGESLSVTPAKENSWLEISSHINSQPGKRGYATYDQVALDLGFTGNPENGYTLSLKDS